MICPLCNSETEFNFIVSMISNYGDRIAIVECLICLEKFFNKIQKNNLIIYDKIILY